jgi:CheY-like chemotaxis protein
MSSSRYEMFGMRRTSSTTTPALSVIVVDDAADNAEVLAEFVESYGHRVRIADCGAVALKLIEQEPADLVLLDIGLPDMDGYQVAATIRARYGGATRIVALTGFSGKEDREAAVRAGCDAFVVKPIGASQIQALLEPGAAL